MLGYAVQPGDTVYEDDPLLYLELGEGPEAETEAEEEIDLDHVRPDLQELIERRALLTDEARPDAVARRRKTGQRTARENITDLCDEGSFVEYGGLAIAAQRSRRPLDELIRKLETANTRQSRRALQGLSFLQMLGQQDTEDGKPIRRYVFAMAQDGRMTLNGSEIGGLIGGLPQ
mgnify:CR=1 FL=1